MKKFKIYLCGVGGQGIGLLNEILIRSANNAGYEIKGADTHGLAQRGGIVVSHLKLGDKNYSPLIAKGDADMVVSLDIHEAMRAMNEYLKDGGILIYYAANLQPIEVRIKNTGRINDEMIAAECKKRNISNFKVLIPDLSDRRFQNVAVVSALCKHNLIPEIKREHYINAISDIMPPNLFDQVKPLF